MRQGQDVLAVPGLAREWLLTNGAGGCARGTAVGVPTRRAHAWLHAADADGRVTTVLLGFDEQLHGEGGPWDLAPPTDPDGAATSAHLGSFSCDPWPAWRLRCGDLVLERSLFLVHGHQAVAVAYRHVAGPGGRLRLGPLVVGRDPDGCQRETPEMQGVAHGIPGRVRVETTPGRPALTLWHNGTFMPVRAWRRGIGYPADAPTAEREDAFVPGYIECPFGSRDAVHVVASTEEGLFRTLAIEGRLGAPPPSTLADCVAALAQSGRVRQGTFVSVAIRGAESTARQAAAAHGEETGARRAPLLDEHDAWATRLVRAMDRGLARRAGRLTVLGGFPASAERGTDALRALPGLIAARAFDAARAVLRGYLEYLDDGVAPAGFDPPHGTPRYDDAEPALWALHAAELLTRRSEDLDWARTALPALESVVQHYRAGSRHGIRVDHDGLLEIGGEQAVKPAALNALWYHALVAMAQLARLATRKESAAFYLAWARQHGQCFNDSFWDESHGCLFESISGSTVTSGLSPGQLLAVSLPPSLLPPERGARLLERVERDLFTPLGLRPAEGKERVETAWLGEFYSACFRIHGRGPVTQARVRGWMDALRARLDEVALDFVPALFECQATGGRRAARKASPEPGLEGWRPRGVSSVAAAELLRVWVEEVEHAEDPASVN